MSDSFALISQKSRLLYSLQTMGVCLSAQKFLLAPNRPYRIRLVARDGAAEYWRDGEKIFTFRDPAPLTAGWFAIRTVKSHLVIRDLRITPLLP